VAALALVHRAAHGPLIGNGLAWLAAHRTADGGWGDTARSQSNLSTTALAWAAFGAAGSQGGCGSHRTVVADAEAWLAPPAGGLEPSVWPRPSRALWQRPHLLGAHSHDVRAGRPAGQGRSAWRRVAPLPFELAVFPHRLYKWLRLPVVSYALPALIAIGQARFHHAPPCNPVARLARHAARAKSLRVLRGTQPESGGFLEAVPITSFVAMSLASIGEARHPVAVRAVEFLRGTARPDGSWPIDANLATWATTLSVNALGDALPDDAREPILQWLLRQQHLVEHPYTHAEPGGWAWTDLSGGVPDADDTAGALLALRELLSTSAPALPQSQS